MLISSTSLLGVELQKSFMFDVLLPNVTGNDGNTWQGASISPFIQSVSFGEYAMEDINPVKHGALKAHSAGVFSIQTVTMDFLADEQGQVLGYFESWRSLVYDSTNLWYYPKASYANGGNNPSGTSSLLNSPCHVTFYNTQGKSLYQWVLLNIFPKTFPAFKMTYEDSSIVKFPIEFAVDGILPNANPSN